MSRKPRSRRAPSASGETRAADTLTVAWMMAVATALCCELAALAIAFYVEQFNPAATGAGLFAGVLMFSAATFGALALMMLPVVVRVRRTAPPRGILVGAIAVGLFPWLALLSGWLP